MNRGAASPLRAPARLIDWSQDPEVRVAITGATGWIGAALAACCHELGLNRENGRLRLFGASARQFKSGHQSFHVEALTGALPLGEGRWHVLHLAYLGKERTEELSAEAFERVNDQLLSEAISLSKTAKSARFFFASSGAAGNSNGDAPSRLQNPYGYNKALHEQHLKQWSASEGTPLGIARIYNVGGPYINKLARYALADFISQARKSGSVKIQAARPVFRSFVDAQELSFVVLLRLIDQTSLVDHYSTFGREVLEMSDLAATVLDVTGNDRNNIIRPLLNSHEPDWYVGGGEHYQTTLAVHGMTPIAIGDIISRTDQFLRALDI